MEQFVAQQNIERFERMLNKLTDPTQRQAVEALLEAEKHKLNHILSNSYLTAIAR